MTELIKLALKFDLKRLLVAPSTNVAIQAFRALFVGGITFIADAGILFLLTLTGIHYLVCAAFSFVGGVIFNYALSVKFVFTENVSIRKSIEIAVYFIISLIGLCLTIGFMWFFTEIIGLFYMISKIIAALLTFAWNFTIRKAALYKKL